MATHPGSGNSTWEAYPSTNTLFTADRAEAMEGAIDANDALLDLLMARPFVRQVSGAATAFTFNGVRQRIPFATVLDSHADVTPSAGGTIFTLNRSGVWRMEAGIRLSASTASQTKYLNLSSSADLSTGGYIEAQELRAGSGGALAVSTSRRFGAGAAVCATLLLLGAGSTATVAADIPEATSIALTWERP